MERRASKKRVENEKATKGDWNGWVSLFIYCFRLPQFMSTILSVEFHTRPKFIFVKLYQNSIPGWMVSSFYFAENDLTAIYAMISPCSCCASQLLRGSTKIRPYQSWKCACMDFSFLGQISWGWSGCDEIIPEWRHLIPNLSSQYCLYLNNQHCPLEKV